MGQVSGVIQYPSPSTIYIATPTITIPDAPSNVGETPTVTTSAFTVVGGSDTHSSTDWQIVKTSDNSIVYQNLGSTANKVSLNVPPNILDESTQYKMRVRYNGATHGSSAWARVHSLQEQILLENGVIEIVSFNSSLDNSTRAYTCSFRVRTEAGITNTITV